MSNVTLDLSLNPVFVDGDGNRVVCGTLSSGGQIAIRILTVEGGVIETTVSRQWVSDAVQSGRLTYLGEQ